VYWKTLEELTIERSSSLGQEAVLEAALGSAAVDTVWRLLHSRW